MNWLSALLKSIPGVVLGIETVIGDRANGATKQQMALDAVGAAENVAASNLTGANATYAVAAAKIAPLIINQTVAVTQANGTYQKATAIATAAQQDVAVAAAVEDLVKSVQTAPGAKTA